MGTNLTIIISIVIFLGIILLLVALLLWVRDRLMPKGEVTITVNDDKVLTVPTGNTLISTLAEQKIYLPSACGGKGSCGQCKCRVVEGGGTILPTEVGFFTRKQIQDHWRLGCQVKVKENLKIVVPKSVLDVKEYECTVVSNRNVATFIKEFKVQLPAGAHIDFIPGSYAQIKIPKFNIRYSDFDKELIGDEYIPAWERFKMFDLRCVNSEPTVRAYSMANYPAEGDVFMLTVRIATPPFKKIKDKFGKIKEKILSIKDKIKALNKKKDYLIQMKDNERVRRGVGYAKDKFLLILKRILPKKCTGYVAFGMDDPASTGKILGAASAFFPIWGDHFTVVPDFENKRLEVDADVRGRIMLALLVIPALKVWFNKDIKYIRRKVDKFKKM